jgi:hypothetical protein
MAIMHHGKNIENRTWAPERTLKIGDRFAIHNAKKIDPAGVTQVMEILIGTRTAFAMDMDELCGRPGVILGTVRFCGTISGGSSTWFSGPIGWMLADPRPLREPIVCLGQQRLWRVPPGIEEMVNENM